MSNEPPSLPYGEHTHRPAAPERAPGHSHTHRHRGGLAGLFGKIFRPHSHDAADAIDAALESDQRGIRAVEISFVGLLVTSIAQLVIVSATGRSRSWPTRFTTSATR